GVLAVGSDTALGTGGIALTGGTVWADSGNRSLANSVSLANTVVLGGRRDFGGTNTVSFTNANNGALTANATIQIDDPLNPATIAGSFGENDTTTTPVDRTLTKTGNGVLVLGGNNFYT